MHEPDAQRSFPRLLPAGDTGLVVELGEDVDETVNDRVLTLDRMVAEARIEGVVETLPTYRSLLVIYAPERLGYGALRQRMGAMLEALPERPEPVVGARWRMPVVYGGEFGIDLEHVASENGLTPEEVVRIHTGAEYRVYMIGFQPGFAYLGGLDARLHISRRTDPRAAVPSGSVSVGGIQTAINSVEAPSGWHLIGRTPCDLFEPARAEPFMLAAGDRVSFEAVPPDAWEPLRRRIEAGELGAERVS